MKKICVVTATRAEYGLLYWIMKEINDANDLELQLVVTGMHLDEKFGNTWKNIENDGFKITSKVSLGEFGDTRASTMAQMAKALVGFGATLSELKPDLVLVLGDRYEIMSVAQAAHILGIPIGHIHGGEVTEGAFDDSIRHAITKMSYLHFTSAHPYRNRVIQMGEDPSRVFNVGAPGLENFIRLELLSKKKLDENLKIKLRDKNLLITYHPVTAINEDGIDAIISALESLKDIGQIITLPNSDPGHEKIFEKWKQYADGKDNVYLTPSLGQLNYLSVMKICSAVVGNSSSGIIEAPFCGVPTINIGQRQNGRIFSNTIINVNDIKCETILSAIKEALSGKYEQQRLFGDGLSAKSIVNILSNKLREEIKPKPFFDIEMRNIK